MIPEELRSLADLDQIVYPLGFAHDASAGSTVDIRWRAGSRTDFVRVQVQSTGASKGGHQYSATLYVSRTEVDCRQTRMQTGTVARNGVDEYYVFLAPVFKDGAGNTIVFDGVNGPDQMAVMELGV